MEKPPLTQAPLGWLRAVTNDCTDEPDEHEVEFRIRSAEDREWYKFMFNLGEIRAELGRRMAN